MTEIGANIGVNESRVSQLHARAIRRLRTALERVMPVEQAKTALRGAILEFQKPRMARASLETPAWTMSGGQASNGVTKPGVVVNYPSASRLARSKSSQKSVASQRQLSPRKRSASVPAASTMKMPRRASAVAAAVAR
jgi:hypothetical protein